jgi:hypothetical protein
MVLLESLFILLKENWVYIVAKLEQNTYEYQSQDKKFKLQIKKENLLMYNSTSS